VLLLQYILIYNLPIWYIYRRVGFVVTQVNALVKLSSKELVADDSKDEPENHTNKQHIGNSWNCMDKGIDYDLLENIYHMRHNNTN
jgi:hypothetical protein